MRAVNIVDVRQARAWNLERAFLCSLALHVESARVVVPF
jgi:hypothetical protein